MTTTWVSKSAFPVAVVPWQQRLCKSARYESSKSGQNSAACYRPSQGDSATRSSFASPPIATLLSIAVTVLWRHYVHSRARSDVLEGRRGGSSQHAFQRSRSGILRFEALRQPVYQVSGQGSIRTGITGSTHRVRIKENLNIAKSSSQTRLHFR